MNNKHRIAFLGGGNMANALINGLTSSGYQTKDIHIIDVASNIIDEWQSKGFSTALSADDNLLNADIWVLSVKPQFLQQALEKCIPFLKKETLIISIAAGITAQSISEWLSTNGQAHTKLVRCMPNTPALVSAGITGVMALSGINDDDKSITTEILQAVGEVVWVDSDDDINAITAISGSGPAYVFLFMNSLLKAGLKLGLNQDQAKRLAISTVYGSSKLADMSDQDLVSLKENVTSKGGTTAAALNVLEHENALETLVQQATQAAYDRAVELSKD